jgi:hypothetical protein
MFIGGFKPGSHHGTFLLVRMGICVHVKGDVWAILIAFHGNDGQSGQTPSVTPSETAQIKKIIAEVWNGTHHLEPELEQPPDESTSGRTQRLRKESAYVRRLREGVE